MLERYDTLSRQMQDALAPIVPDGVHVVIVVSIPEARDVFTVSNTGSRNEDRRLCAMAAITGLTETRQLSS